MRRGQRRWCQSCRKTTFKQFKAAMHIVHKTDAERAYWCPEAGGYHITGIPRAEWDAAQALRAVVVIDLSVQSREHLVILQEVATGETCGTAAPAPRNR